MNNSQKLDLILEKLSVQEKMIEEQQLHDLSMKHWGLTLDNIQMIELTKQLLDRGKGNEGKVFQFLFAINGLVDKVGTDQIIEYLNKAEIQ